MKSRFSPGSSPAITPFILAPFGTDLFAVLSVLGARDSALGESAFGSAIMRPASWRVGRERAREWDNWTGLLGARRRAGGERPGGERAGLEMRVLGGCRDFE